MRSVSQKPSIAPFDCEMCFFSPPFVSIWRLYKHAPNPKCIIGFPCERLPSVFSSCFHHLCLATLKYMNRMADAQLTKRNSFTLKLLPCYSRSSCASLLWYSSKSGRPLSRAYRKRVNRRLKLARKPILDEMQFDKAVSQLPARFTADDLHDVLSLENDPLVCLELFNWASRQHRFKHSVTTFHKTIQKLGIAGMIEEMYDIVDQVLALPHFGSEALCNTIIYYLTKARKLSRAVTVFKHMKKVKNSDCRPSIRTYNLLFATFLARGRNTYINHMYMGTMESLFKQMINDRIEPDIFTLNSMILGYVLSNHVNDALRIFHQMGVVYTSVPDSFTYDHLIYGLCAQSRTNNASELFDQMREKGFNPSAKTYNSLVNAFALVGEIDKALKYLWEMTESQKPVDFITYKTLLDEFCRKGRAVEALNSLMELDNMVTDDHLQEEYVLLDLDDVCGQVDIPPDETYILSGLDTLNPILTIGDKLKLIGEYEETIGTCLIFSENAETAPTADEDRGSSGGNLYKDTYIVGPNQASSKQVKPVTSLQKILKFRLLSETDEQDDLTEKPTGLPENV